jgi:hypothetical protein
MPDETTTATIKACRDGNGTLVFEQEFCFEGGASCFGVNGEVFPIRAIPGEAHADGLKLVSELKLPVQPEDQKNQRGFAPWQAVNVRVHNVGGRRIAALAVYGDGLRLADVTHPESPELLGHVPVTTGFEIINDIKFYDAKGGTYVAAASSTRGLLIVDVTNPEMPEEVAAVPDPSDMPKPPGPPDPDAAVEYDVHTVALETRPDGATWAYLGSVTGQGLEVYDVSEPSAPVKLGAYQDENLPDVDVFSGDFAHDLYVENGVAYLAYWGLGLIVVDANDPTDIRKFGEFTDYPWYDGSDRRTAHSVWVTEAGGRKIAILGGEGSGTHLRVIDADPASMQFMQEIGSWASRAEPAISIHNVMADGDTAYIAHYQDGIRLVDLSDPTAPVSSGHYNTWFDEDGNPGRGDAFFEGAVGLDIDTAEGLVYVADDIRGLMVLSIEAQTGPTGPLTRPECPAGTYQGICTEVNGIEAYAFCWGGGPAKSYFQCDGCQLTGKMPNQELSCQ